MAQQQRNLVAYVGVLSTIALWWLWAVPEATAGNIERPVGVAKSVYKSGAWRLSANQLTESLRTESAGRATFGGSEVTSATLTISLDENPSIELFRLANSVIPVHILESSVVTHTLTIDGNTYGPWKATFRYDGLEMFLLIKSCRLARMDHACASADVDALFHRLLEGEVAVWQYKIKGYGAIQEEFSLRGLPETYAAHGRLEPR